MMVLSRTYRSERIAGVIEHSGSVIAHTFEQPHRYDASSCVDEGEYIGHDLTFINADIADHIDEQTGFPDVQGGICIADVNEFNAVLDLIGAGESLTITNSNL
jgi:hypothetical protein